MVGVTVAGDSAAAAAAAVASAASAAIFDAALVAGGAAAACSIPGESMFCWSVGRGRSAVDAALVPSPLPVAAASIPPRSSPSRQGNVALPPA